MSPLCLRVMDTVFLRSLRFRAKSGILTGIGMHVYPTRLPPGARLARPVIRDLNTEK